MALAPCRECRQTISTEAQTCPHCGVPRPTDPAAPPAPSAPPPAGSAFRAPRPAPPSGTPPRPQPPPSVAARADAHGYIAGTLLPDERILYRARLHWLPCAIGPAILFLVGLLTIGQAPIVPGFFFTLTAVFAVWGLIRYTTTEFALTDRRVLAKVGWLWRQSREVLLLKIESLDVHQGPLGRLANYGTVVIAGTGGTRERFTGIAAPLDLRRRVQQQIELGRQTGGRA